MRFFLAFAFVLLAAPAAAQRTWVVDLLNRPGTDFTDLPPAVQAAAPGDTLHVRFVDPTQNLFYTAPAITRGLTIVGVGAGKPQVQGVLTVSGVPAGETFAFVNMAMGTPVRTNIGFLCRGNSGVIALDSVDYGQNGLLLFSNQNMMLFETCSLVTITRSQIWNTGTEVTFKANTTAFVVQSSLQDWAAGPIRFGGSVSNAVSCEDSVLHLVDCVVRGTNGWVDPWCRVSTPGTHAVWLDRGTLYVSGLQTRIQGGMNVGGGPGCIPTGGVADIGGISGTVFIDPKATLVYGLSSRFNLVTGPIPSLTARAGSPGTTLDTTVYSTPGTLAFLALGAPAPQPTVLPFGEAWLRLPSVVLLGFGVTDPQCTWNAGFPLGPSLPPGLHAGLQAVVLPPGSGVALTNPAVTAVF